MIEGHLEARFREVVETFLQARDERTFCQVVGEGITLLNTPREEPWRSIHETNGFIDDFYEVRVSFDRELSADEISRASGALGYALRSTLAGESLSEPTIVECEGLRTLLEYGYDSTKSQRDDPDYDAAFLLAHRYIEEGTPLRKTDRAGANTRGTRLVEGIGGDMDIRFFVR